MMETLSLHLRKEPIPLPTESKDNRGWKKYGDNNLYPEFLYGLYRNSSILSSIINGFHDYICGSGFEIEFDEETVMNRGGDNLLDIVKRCISDYLVFGAFCLQSIKNSYGDIAEIYWIDVRKIRLGNEDNERSIWYCKDWNNSRYKKVQYPKNDSIAPTSLWYFKRPTEREDYGTPIYHSAIKSIMTDIEISNYHYVEISNGFTPAALVSFHAGTPDEETKRKMQKAFEDKFTSTENAARIMLTFDDSKENGVEVNKIAEDNYDQRYLALASSVMKNIYGTFRASPVLFGIQQENQGFNQTEYQAAYALFKKTVIEPLQYEIEKAFSKVGIEFSLKEFQVDFGTTTNEGGTL